ncbi:hypothetical protein [Dethiobacter alkaliphilus]|uniref:hypothetical protein n=1 Tax=Dethiobacter alkaliphilus TaxID=427926 RepID=UPI002227A7E8|nr:hypothetical protein [Dethiobacter alkaliphilus]MCW3491694.1 hypothetical protein [Dethiobacter alkaliphilus]
MSKKQIALIIIIYSLTTFILHNVLNTAIGGFLMTLSQLALAISVIVIIYLIIKVSIRQFFYNRK